MQTQGLEKTSPKRAVELRGGARFWGFFGEVILREGKAVRIVLRKGKEGWQVETGMRPARLSSENPHLPLALALGDELRAWAQSRPQSPLHRLFLRVQLLFLRPPTEEELRAGAMAVRRATEACGKLEPGGR